MIKMRESVASDKCVGHTLLFRHSLNDAPIVHFVERSKIVLNELLYRPHWIWGKTFWKYLKNIPQLDAHKELNIYGS